MRHFIVSVVTLLLLFIIYYPMYKTYIRIKRRTPNPVQCPENC